MDRDAPIVSEPDAPLSQVEGHQFLQYRCAHEFLLLLSVEVLGPLFGIWVLQRQVAVSISVSSADAQHAVQVQIEYRGDELVGVDNDIMSTRFSISEFNNTDLHMVWYPGPRNSLRFGLSYSLDLWWNDELEIAFQTVHDYLPPV